jgi:hypothetical protein
MAWRSPERALERKIAELARLNIDDMRAVLDALEPGQRMRIEQRLHQQDKAGTRFSDAVQASAALSPWLVDRSEGRGPTLTAATRTALARAAADALPRRPAPPRTTGSGLVRPGLVERSFAALAGKRAR